MDLDNRQTKAAETARNCVVAGGPGTGKTAVLVEKAVRRINAGLAPELVMIVTGSKKEAPAIRNELQQRLGRARANVVRVGDSFSLALKELEKSGTRVMRAKRGHRRIAALEASRAVGADIRNAEAQHLINKIKSANGADHGMSDEAVRMAEIYTYELRKRNVFDEADIFQAVLDGVADGRICPQAVAEMLVDDFQEFAPTSQAWIRTHIDAGATFTVAGDEDQAVYLWSADQGPSGIQRLVNDYGAQVIELNSDYRCPDNLTQASISLIAKNTGRMATKPRTGLQGEGNIMLAEVDSPEKEATLIAEAAEDLPLAILARSSDYLDTIEMALALRGVLYHRKDHRSVLSHPIFRRLVDLCRVTEIRDLSSAQAAFQRIDVHLGGWKKVAGSLGVPEDPARVLLGERPDLIGVDHEVLEVIRVMDEWHAINEEDPLEALHAIIDWVAEREDEPLWVDRMKRVTETLESEDMNLGDIADHLEAMILRAVGKRAKDDTEPEPEVDLTTIHRVRGETHDHVWMAGISEGLFPYPDNDIEAERRLMYIAMTRARESFTATAVTGAGQTTNVFRDELEGVLGETACLKIA